jgi:hypothetical protein
MALLKGLPERCSHVQGHKCGHDLDMQRWRLEGKKSPQGMDEMMSKGFTHVFGDF